MPQLPPSTSFLIHHWIFCESGFWESFVKQDKGQMFGKMLEELDQISWCTESPSVFLFVTLPVWIKHRWLLVFKILNCPKSFHVFTKLSYAINFVTTVCRYFMPSHTTYEYKRNNNNIHINETNEHVTTITYLQRRLKIIPKCFCPITKQQLQ